MSFVLSIRDMASIRPIDQNANQKALAKKAIRSLEMRRKCMSSSSSICILMSHVFLYVVDPLDLAQHVTWLPNIIQDVCCL